MILPDQPAPTEGYGDVWAELLAGFIPEQIRPMCEEALDLAVYLWGVSSLCAREGRWIAAWAWRMVARGVLVVAWGLR